jgi:hypothetical protein
VSLTGKDKQKQIEEQLYNARGKLKLKHTTDVIAGLNNLQFMDQLTNRGRIKRLLSDYMKTAAGFH